MKSNDFRRWVKPRRTYQRLSRQSFVCPVVSEQITATLRFRPAAGESRFFVECDQHECQYCEVNEPPCPLNLQMFAGVIAARRAEGGRRGDDDDGTGPDAVRRPA
jgi:NAD-dependent dihydropyrimidine dehydrogenase PreA subunit